MGSFSKIEKGPNHSTLFYTVCFSLNIYCKTKAAEDKSFNSEIIFIKKQARIQK